jgi:hypothetical protein
VPPQTSEVPRIERLVTTAITTGLGDAARPATRRELTDRLVLRSVRHPRTTKVGHPSDHQAQVTALGVAAKDPVPHQAGALEHQDT